MAAFFFMPEFDCIVNMFPHFFIHSSVSEHPGASCLDRCEGAVVRSRGLCLRSLVCGARSLKNGSARSRAAMALPFFFLIHFFYFIIIIF